MRVLGEDQMKKFSDFGIDVKGLSGETKTICPQCSGQRKKKNYPCLNVNLDKGVWHCWHCEWSGSLSGGIWREAQKKVVYSRPVAADKKLSAQWRCWLNQRGISDQTIDDNGIFNQKVYMPQIEAETDAVCFPFYRNSELINIKYRDAQKNFRMAAGAERILYGLDQIAEDCLIWVEGEIDKLSLYEAGFKSCVSVPDGAPSPSTRNYSSKFDYLETSQAIIEKIKKHVIAVDEDEPGQKLRAELVRRIGAEKCYIARWPAGCKDANEVLTRLGKDVVIEAIEFARPAPIEGTFSVSEVFDDLMELYQNGEVGGLTAGWPEFDKLYTVRPGDFTVVTGIPSHGKSEFLDALIIKLAQKHGLRFALCSPENQPIHLHVKKLAEKWAGRPFFEKFNDRMTVEELISSCGDLNNHFTFILPESPTIDCILRLARASVLRDGINGLVIDPWNELEHSRPPGLSETEYISDSLRKMRQFARQNNIHLWVVAHPTKLQKRNGRANEYEVPTPYDIAGSANWRNKADNCLTVYRNPETVDVLVQKIRVKEVGRIGVATFKYKLSTGEFVPV